MPVPSTLRTRSLRRALVFVLAVFMLGMIAVTSYTQWRLRVEAVETGLDMAAMYSRGSEDFVTENLQLAELVSANLLDLVPLNASPAEVQKILAAMLRQAPALRSLSLLDSQGHIIASSNPGNIGVAVADTGFLPPSDSRLNLLRIGPPWAGRDFAGGHPTEGGKGIGTEPSSLIPIQYSRNVGGRKVTLLAALNPDFFVNHLQQQLEGGSIEVLRYDGLVLLDTATPEETGASHAEILKSLHLSEMENGQFPQLREDGEAILTAFRASRLYPFVVVTHVERKKALQSWRTESLALWGVELPVMAGICLFAWLFYRRERQQAAQQAEAERLQRINASVFASSSDAIIITDTNARILSVNAAFTRISGYAAAEAIGKTPRILKSGWQSQQFYKSMWDALLLDGQWRGEVLNRRKDGSFYDCQLAITVSRDAAGRIEHLIGVCRDITREKAAEAQLRKLSLAVEQSPVSIMITNLERHIEYVNQAFVEMTGFSRTEALGRSPAFLQSGKTANETYQTLSEALHRGQSWTGELHNRRKDGRDYLAHSIILPLRQAGGGVTHYVAMQEDVTEKKALSQELERHRHHLEELVALRTRELESARRQAEAATEAKSMFLATMSHEIRTPLNGIMGMARLVADSPLEDIARERMDMLLSSAESLRVIINDILDFSKLEADKLDFERKPFDLQALLRDVLSLLQLRAAEKGIFLKVETAPEIPAWLDGDPGRLRQVLLNLAGNAVKFTEKGGVTIDIVSQTNLEGRYTLRFDVIDTGIGIGQDAQDRLFQSFSQADASISRRYGGTGLGLIICKKLVENQGGQIGMSSEPGKGSRFWFTLPAQAAAPSAALRIPAAGERPDRPLRILLAEDNLVNQKVVLGLLSRENHLVTVVANGRDAVTAALAAPFDVILMDLQMPEMDGLTACREIRAHQPQEQQAPIIALTANATQSDMDKCREAGMIGHIGKPVDPLTLTQTLWRLLRESDA